MYYQDQNLSYQQSIQRMFPQPQGTVYSINSPVEIGNIPIGSTGLSVALCLSEGLMYIKSFQSGGPVIMAYSIKPYTKDSNEVAATPNLEVTKSNENNVEYQKMINELQERIYKIEQIINKNNDGGKFNGLL